MKRIFTLMFIAITFIAFGQSYHTITIDGTNDFNTTYERMQTTSLTTLYSYVTWDASNLYLGLSGNSPAGTVTDANRVYHVYIDTDPQTNPLSGNGTNDGITWRWDPTLPFNADYHYAFKTVDNSEYKNYYSGTSWTSATISTSNYKASGFWELSISLSDLGTPSAINIVIYVEEDWGGGSICGGLPSNLFTNTSSQGAITFNSHWKGYNLVSGINPNESNYTDLRFISGTETISTNTTWAGLTILSGGSLTINVNKALTVNGTFTNNAGASGLVIQSDATGTGSLIVSSGTPAATVQRYMTTYTTNSDGWHLLSAPVASFTISGSDFVPGSGEDLYEFSESAADKPWLNYTGGTFGDTQFEVGKGYLVAYASSTTNPKTFTGNINTGTVTKSLSYTSGSAGEGWNLLGNPYTSAIDWDLLTKTSNVDGAVYVLRASDGAYISWNGSTGDLTNGIIPAMQGFFVKTTASGESVTMESSDQVHSTTNYYKAGKELADNSFVIKVTGSEGESNTYIQFREDATKSFDHAFDAYKLFGYSVAPQIYTGDGENLYSINCLPFDVQTYSLPLGVRFSTPGDYRLSFKDIENISNNFEVKLEDLQTGTLIPVNHGTVYQFTFNKGDEPDRFLLHFSNITSTPEMEKENTVVVFAHGNGIVIKSGDKELNGTLDVLNMLGQKVYSQEVNHTYSERINIYLNKGVYIVRYRDVNGEVHSQKVILQ